MREVHEAEWPSFADQFSRLHKGQPAVVETSEPNSGTQMNARYLPLMGITAEPEGSGGTRMGLLLGDSTGAHLAHDIGRVSHVRVAEWNDAVSSALEIESEDGVVTEVRVGPAEQTLPPGYITDGVVLQHASHTDRSND